MSVNAMMIDYFLIGVIAISCGIVITIQYFKIRNLSDHLDIVILRANNLEASRAHLFSIILEIIKPNLTPIRGYADIILTEHWGQLALKQKQKLEIIKSKAAFIMRVIAKLEKMQE